MRSDARGLALVAAVAAVLAACGGFGRGKRTPDAGCDSELSGPGFETAVLPILESECRVCHDPSGVGSGSAFVLGGSDTYATVVALVDTDAPENSSLLRKATGHSHDGGARFATASVQYRTIRDWIAAGAPRSGSRCPADRDAALDATVSDGDAGGEGGIVGDAGEFDAASSGLDDAAVDAAAGDAGKSDAGEPPSFATAVHPLLVADCQSCHNTTGVASGTGLHFSGDPVADYAVVLTYIDVSAPATSPLLVKALGTAHGGGERFPEGSTEYEQLLAWIEAGAAP